MNGDKIRKAFVKELRKLLKINDEFEDVFSSNLVLRQL